MYRPPLNRPWSDADEDQLVFLVNEGRSNFCIAARLKRTVSAVRTCISTLRARENGRRGRSRDQSCVHRDRQAT